jgi:DNA repair exonuclease SbcCD ATPase subunit
VRIASISIANMAAFESFETKLPAVALIQGKNGNGKTSLLDCLKYAMGRGHNEDMIHGDAPEGEILIEFDNGAAVKCRAVRDKHETTRSWRAPGSKRFVVSRDQIDAIGNAISYDPLAFMEMPEKQQVETLLRIMPIQCSEEEIRGAIGDVDIQPIEAEDGNAMVRIDTLRKMTYNRRRDFNVAVDTQEKHAAELEKALPPDAPEGTDWDKEAARLRQEKNQAEADQNFKLNTIRTLFEDEKSAAQKEYMDAVEAAGQARDQRIEAGRTQANRAANELRMTNAPRLQQLESDLTIATERAKSGARAEGTRQAAKAAKADAAQQRQESAKLTAALKRLDQLKESVASRLPIKGIVIQDGRILRQEDGNLVPFARWNTEAKMRFCLRIAVLAHGEAGFICVDNAEHFDQEKRMALVETASKYAEKDGLQFLIASVSDHPLSVTAAGE